MRTLKDHVILYDAECPMCKLYTSAFVKSGMLEETGRACYQHMTDSVAPRIDLQKAVNEIALVNLRTGNVTYGIHSLFSIIGYGFPVFRRLFAFGPFVWLMRKVYAFVSYNRRVIIPVAPGRPAGLQPSFNLRYRLAYLVFTWLVTAYILSHFSQLLTGVVPAGGRLREYLICGGQIVFQGLIAVILYRKKVGDYLGNMMTVSFAGALLLLPALLMANFFPHHPIFYASSFMLVAFLMLLEHIRRTKLLAIGWVLTCTWIAYRAGVLLLIYFL